MSKNKYMGINGFIYNMTVEEHSAMKHPENFELMETPTPPLLAQSVKPKRKYKKRKPKA